MFLFHNVTSATVAWRAGGAGAAEPWAPTPIKRLVDFERVSLAAGESKTVTFTLSSKSFATHAAYAYVCDVLCDCPHSFKTATRTRTAPV